MVHFVNCTIINMKYKLILFILKKKNTETLNWITEYSGKIETSLNCEITNGNTIDYTRSYDCKRACLERFNCKLFSVDLDGGCWLKDSGDTYYNANGLICGRIVNRSVEYAEAQKGKHLTLSLPIFWIW